MDKAKVPEEALALRVRRPMEMVAVGVKTSRREIRHVAGAAVVAMAQLEQMVTLPTVALVALEEQSPGMSR